MKIFRRPLDFKRISLETKLHYYRNVVHNLCCKLDMFRISNPEIELASAHRKVKIYVEEKDSIAKLESLHNQACSLCKFVVNWNSILNEKTGNPKNNLDMASLNTLDNKSEE